MSSHLMSTSEEDFNIVVVNSESKSGLKHLFLNQEHYSDTHLTYRIDFIID